MFSPSSAILPLSKSPTVISGFFDETLLEKANGAIEFLEFALNDFIRNLLRFALHLRPINLAFGFYRFPGTSARLT